MSLLSPTLPPELERYIFEICASCWPISIPNLILVAYRVKVWMEPLLYRTMAVEYEGPIAEFPPYPADNIISAIHKKPPSFFHGAVRHLSLFNNSTYHSEEILGACTGVENLWLSDLQDAWIPLIASLPLKHLYTSCYSLLHALPPTHQVFSRLTHLEIDDCVDDPDGGGGLVLAALPHLTHLSFSHSGLILICPRLLECSTTLRVLVYLNRYEPLHNETQAVGLARDVRFVVMRLPNYIRDWCMGAQYGADYWTKAEEFIARRRRGEIDPLQYVIPN
ncbi:hypothetical protein C8R47DRAFT_1141779 [Mycena vitilis]|nr:hypothetical protein C8R47DRAFT_1141779 [Mycena vitilis]